MRYRYSLFLIQLLRKQFLWSGKMEFEKTLLHSVCVFNVYSFWCSFSFTAWPGDDLLWSSSCCSTSLYAHFAPFSFQSWLMTHGIESGKRWNMALISGKKCAIISLIAQGWNCMCIWFLSSTSLCFAATFAPECEEETVRDRGWILMYCHALFVNFFTWFQSRLSFSQVYWTLKSVLTS